MAPQWSRMCTIADIRSTVHRPQKIAGSGHSAEAA
jgi:hypothetical protein